MATIAKRDLLKECLAAGRKHGIEVHIWRVNWNLAWTCPESFKRKLSRAGRVQRDAAGKELNWLCPTNPANQKLELDVMLEVARNYDVDGVHFDYIRYPGTGGCYCNTCRATFEKRIGEKVKRWPADVLNNGPHSKAWSQFRQDNITRLVRSVHEQVRPIRKGIRISAAVFRNWVSDRHNVGQDWKLWCERGYLDFVCPMDYTPNNLDFEQKVTRQLEWSGKVPCYPGIGLSVWGSPRDIVKLIEQIQIARRLGTGGFTIFNYGVPEARRIVPLCGEGVTRKEARR
jgi:uncharacterized lipoprotein YddW (UPF0748 family)